MEKACNVGHYTTFIGVLGIAEIGDLEELLWEDGSGSSTIIGVQSVKYTNRDTEVFLGNLESQTRVTMTVILNYGTSEMN